MPMIARSALAVAALVIITSTVASAHVPELVTPDTLWSSWSLEPVVFAALVLTSWLYTRGVDRLWTQAGRGRGVSVPRVCSFAAGQAAVAVALISPLDTLGGTLLSAHMAQHGVLAGIAPPLLLLGHPGLVFAWAVRGQSARAMAPLWHAAATIEPQLSGLLFATLFYGVTTWVWHAPSLFGAAVQYDWVHAAQHLSFFVPAMFFWNALLGVASPRRAACATAAAFATFMHTGLLGGLITMAPEPLYVAYVGRTAAWNLTPLADQQLAGVLMWVPLGLPYIAAGLWLGSRLLAGAEDDVRAPGSNVSIGPV
jgi:putative membrane protein